MHVAGISESYVVWHCRWRLVHVGAFLSRGLPTGFLNPNTIASISGLADDGAMGTVADLIAGGQPSSGRAARLGRRNKDDDLSEGQHEVPVTPKVSHVTRMADLSCQRRANGRGFSDRCSGRLVEEITFSGLLCGAGDYICHLDHVGESELVRNPGLSLQCVWQLFGHRERHAGQAAPGPRCRNIATTCMPISKNRRGGCGNISAQGGLSGMSLTEAAILPHTAYTNEARTESQKARWCPTGGPNFTSHRLLLFKRSCIQLCVLDLCTAWWFVCWP